MKKLLVALLTSAFFFLLATKGVEAALGCSASLFTSAEPGQFTPVNGQVIPATLQNAPYVGYRLDPQDVSGANAIDINRMRIHWCWRNTEGLGLGYGACQSNSLSTQELSDTRIIIVNQQSYLVGRLDAYTGSQPNTQWEVAPWLDGQRTCLNEGTSIVRTGEVAEYTCGVPGVSATYTNQQVHVGVAVSAAGMDNRTNADGSPQRTYYAMIKPQGFNLTGGWATGPLILDGDRYEGGVTAELPNGNYTVVIADNSNLMCKTITDNFDIRNCAVFPQCSTTLTVNTEDPDDQVDYDDRDQTIDDAAQNMGDVPYDTITPFSLCRQIPILTTTDIDRQVAQIQDPETAANLRTRLQQNANKQRQEKRKCCLCTYGTNAVDPETGACQGEIGTPGQTDRESYYFRRDFKPGIYTAVGCIGADSESIVTRLVRIGIGLAGGIALLMILAGAFLFTTSQGEPKRASQAKELITSAIMGLVFIIFSVTLLQFIGVEILHIPGFGATDETGQAVQQ